LFALFCIFQAILAVFSIFPAFATSLTAHAHHAINHAIVTKIIAISQFFQDTIISHNCFIICTHFSQSNSNNAKEGFSLSNISFSI